MNFNMLVFFSFLLLIPEVEGKCSIRKLLQTEKDTQSPLAEKCPTGVEFWWNEGWTPLHNAVLGNELAAARKLLETGSDVNQRNSSGETPLFHAVQFHYRDMLALLIKYNADLLARDNEGATSLNRLMQYSRTNTKGFESVIRLFLDSLGFHKTGTCENQHWALSATGKSIRFFQKINGTVANYIPTFYGKDISGNDRIQSLAEDNVYPGTIKVIMNLEWEHETQSISGHLIFDDFYLSDNWQRETKVEIKNLECRWKKWKKFLAIVKNN